MKAERAGGAGRVLLCVLGRTWRVSRLKPGSGVRKDSVLFALWHGVQLILIYTHRKMGIHLLISRSRDGSLVSALCKKIGFGVIRGSSSKGGVSAVREIVKALREGYPVAITPDGPKGPAEVVKKGVSLIPRRAGVPVVPYGVSAFPAVRLKSWDKFMIPLPFARVVISEGRPIPPENCSEEVLNAAISTETRRAELAASPAASVLILFIKTLGLLITPFARLVLRFRPKTERKERWGSVPKSTERPVWLHGSSLGEIKGLLPVVDYLKQNNVPYYITCSTAAARQFIENMNMPGSFQPLDIPGAVSRFLDNIQPSALILAETEFWPVLLYETVVRGIPAGMVNARLSQKSAKGYRFIKPLFSRIMKCFTGILTRTETDSERFLSFGINTETAGDGKAAVKAEVPDPSWVGKIKNTGRGILVAGSTRKGEEKVLLEVARRTGLTPVIVPRHNNRISEVVSAAQSAGYSPDLWSKNPVQSECLVVDVKGVLAALYGLADIAFVGGTIAPVGGHNILEPLAHGVPVIVGPEHSSFADVVKTASESNICRVFNSVDSGVAAVEELLNRDPGSIQFTYGAELFTGKLMKLLKKMGVVF